MAGAIVLIAVAIVSLGAFIDNGLTNIAHALNKKRFD